MKNQLLKPILITIGFISLGLGALGAVLPLLPTAPFVLLAAACFAKSSERFYNWLIANRMFGPTIVHWRESRSIPRKSKYMAMATVVISGAISISMLEPVMLKLVVVGFLLIPTTIILRAPTTENLPQAASNSQSQSAQ